MTDWTKKDSAAAIKQGWEIFSVDGDLGREVTIVDGLPYGKRPFELQRLDESDRFPDDISAWRFVYAQAGAGDDLAGRALAFLEEHSPKEWCAIMRSVR